MAPAPDGVRRGGTAGRRAGAEMPFAETGGLAAGGAGLGNNFRQGEFRCGESIGGSSTDRFAHSGTETVAASDEAGPGRRAHRAGPGIGEPDAGSGERIARSASRKLSIKVMLFNPANFQTELKVIR